MIDSEQLVDFAVGASLASHVYENWAYNTLAQHPERPLRGLAGNLKILSELSVGIEIMQIGAAV